jgi:hypothetical protein
VEALEKEKSLDMQGIKAQFLGCPFNGSVGVPTTSTFFLAICAPFLQPVAYAAISSSDPLLMKPISEIPIIIG